MKILKIGMEWKGVKKPRITSKIVELWFHSAVCYHQSGQITRQNDGLRGFNEVQLFKI